MKFVRKLSQNIDSIFHPQIQISFCVFLLTTVSSMGLFLPCWRRFYLQCHWALKQWKSQRLLLKWLSALVWEQVSRIFTGSSSGGDKASCASYHLLSDGTSVSLQSNLNQPCWLPGNTWGEKENQCWPGSLWFFIRSLSLLINFKICFRDLMSHPLISPRWTCLKVLPLWSAELKKGLKIQFPELWSINISATSVVLLV